MEDDFKFGLEICLYVLRGLNLNHYVKLERDEGPDRIYNFALKYDIKEFSKDYDEKTYKDAIFQLKHHINQSKLESPFGMKKPSVSN